MEPVLEDLNTSSQTKLKLQFPCNLETFNETSFEGFTFQEKLQHLTIKLDCNKLMTDFKIFKSTATTHLTVFPLIVLTEALIPYAQFVF